jgi:hypothetical protein
MGGQKCLPSVPSLLDKVQQSEREHQAASLPVSFSVTYGSWEVAS